MAIKKPAKISPPKKTDADDLPTTTKEIKLRQELARLNLMEDEVKKLRGELVSVDAINEAMSATGNAVARILTAASSKIAPQLSRSNKPATCKKIVDKELATAIDAIRNLDIADIVLKYRNMTASQKSRTLRRKRLERNE